MKGGIHHASVACTDLRCKVHIDDSFTGIDEAIIERNHKCILCYYKTYRTYFSMSSNIFQRIGSHWYEVYVFRKHSYLITSLHNALVTLGV